MAGARCAPSAASASSSAAGRRAEAWRHSCSCALTAPAVRVAYVAGAPCSERRGGLTYARRGRARGAARAWRAPGARPAPPAPPAARRGGAPRRGGTAAAARSPPRPCASRTWRGPLAQRGGEDSPMRVEAERVVQRGHGGRQVRAQRRQRLQQRGGAARRGVAAQLQLRAHRPGRARRVRGGGPLLREEGRTHLCA
ncbi:unnamed protein product [Arctia plantaginis]|uniref:Uncharacterized protein n=1 Tax=Arctia plantaginis TaxID=874455 RepID=A0A8S1B920_ARCPL|nr:unnamed protein product [Arctia plantaginis]CAB3254299.1 unnamed protein product [Arctia plantaginis]CAB3254300.1 unnamed protein product [Arctia plantaginis]CAB3254301.1 unnamed protein product [Arctia plantaginis]